MVKSADVPASRDFNFGQHWVSIANENALKWAVVEVLPPAAWRPIDAHDAPPTATVIRTVERKISESEARQMADSWNLFAMERKRSRPTVWYIVCEYYDAATQGTVLHRAPPVFTRG